MHITSMWPILRFTGRLHKTIFAAVEAEKGDGWWGAEEMRQYYDGGGVDRGAHGAFDSRSHPHSAQLWLSQHRGLVAAALLAAGAVLGTAGLRRR